MRLTRFRVERFRSIRDSGWVSCEDVTTLVGVNEAGKSNLLLALWKLKPARDGDVDLLRDLPRADYSQLRNMKIKPRFVTAEFELGALADELAERYGVDADELATVHVSRRYDALELVRFPNEKKRLAARSAAFVALLEQLENCEFDPEEPEQARLAAFVQDLADELRPAAGTEWLLEVDLQEAAARLGSLADGTSGESTPVSDAIAVAVAWVRDALDREPIKICSHSRSCHSLVWNSIPSFVYYANYGNLDSEIYLPHVIENLGRKDLGSKDAAKARTLRVLFEFLDLDPQEILELGREARPPHVVDEQEIEDTNVRKKEREVLLHSAATKLTKSFREWWKQGQYQFEFGADGTHFRIWVSDVQRTDRVELESRSTGLQWFLSFFLVFLVEAGGEHENCILLLDEAGVTLHPLAQADLIGFFSSLAEENQIIHTTHSPFLVDVSRVDRARSVYVDADGFTTASADMRRSESDLGRSNSVYAVHAAIGLSVADTLLHGCAPVIVEGASDQFYLSALLQFLISKGELAPPREVVFAPCGGVRGVKPLAGVLMAKESALPPVVVDSDDVGRQFAEKLKSGLYAGAASKIIELSDATGMDHSEIEDLLPPAVVAAEFDKLYAAPLGEHSAADELDESRPIRPQLEHVAAAADVRLEAGWNVELARRVCRRIRKSPNLLTRSSRGDAVAKVFESLLGAIE